MANICYTHYFFYSEEKTKVEKLRERLLKAIFVNQEVKEKATIKNYEKIDIVNTNNIPFEQRNTKNIMEKLNMNTSMLGENEYTTIQYLIDTIYQKDKYFVFEICCTNCWTLKPKSLIEMTKQLNDENLKIAFVAQEPYMFIFVKYDKEKIFCPEDYYFDYYYEDINYINKKCPEFKAIIETPYHEYTEEFAQKVFGTTNIKKIQKRCEEINKISKESYIIPVKYQEYPEY